MAKDSKLKVPKRIAGVKVPKKARKTANRALAVAGTPQARDLAVAALTAAAAALGKRQADDAADRSASAPAPDFDDVREQAARLRDVVVAAALEGARRLLDGLEAPAESSDGPPRAKRRRARAGRPASGRAAGPEGAADA